MKYILIVNQFWKLDAGFCFSPSEIALFFYVLKRANDARWASAEVMMDNSHAMLKFKLGRTTLATIQARLVDAGIFRITQGSGRGNGCRYLILLANKGVSANTPLEGKGADKGVLADTPLQKPSSLKVLIKVSPSVHLYLTYPADTVHPGPPKIEDTITKISKLILVPKPAKPTKEKIISALYSRCIDEYDRWCIENAGGSAKIDGVQGNAMKAMITYLRKEVKRKNPTVTEVQAIDDLIVKSWLTILSKRDILTTWLEKQVRLVDFNSHLQNILKAIRDEHANATGNPPPTPPPVTRKDQQRGSSVSDLQSLKSDRNNDTAEPAQ